MMRRAMSTQNAKKTRGPSQDAVRAALREYGRRRRRHEYEGQQLLDELGQKTRQARRAGITMYEIADLAQVARQTVYRTMARARRR
jgi:hypothetical protein